MTFYYDSTSVKEGIDTETYQHNDSFINKTLSKKYNGCCVLFYNRTNFNYKGWTCDRCYKFLLDTDFKPKNICIIWWNNCKHRMLTTLKHEQAQKFNGKRKDTR